MSAFMVSNGTIHNSVTALIPSAMTGDKSGTAMGKKLLALNVYSLQQLYPDSISEGEMQGYADQIRTYEYSELKNSDVQNLKSLQCLSYQACEGDTPHHPLFKRVEETVEVLTQAISKGKTIMRWGAPAPDLPGYDEANWD